jgi:predicted permease
MGWLGSVASRIGWLFRRPRLEHEMDAEFRIHLEKEIADLMGTGLSPSEARRRALRDFGRLSSVKEEARAARGIPRLEALGRDLRFAARSIRRSPGAPAAAAMTLTLAIAATTAVAHAVQKLWLDPIPLPHPDRLAVVWESQEARGVRENVVSVPNFEEWASRSRSFAQLAAVVPDHEVLQRDGPERVAGALVSPAWFSIVGVAPALGRPFTDADVAAGEPVIVLSHGLWRERFGADPHAVGSEVPFGDRLVRVIGVMPAGFQPPAFGWLGSGQRYWRPFVATADNRQWGRFLLVLGRLAPGLTVRQASAEMAAIAAQLEATHPRNKGWSAHARPLVDQIVGEVKPVLLAVAVAALALLLAAIANLTTVMLARARRRRAELAVRVALGASRGRIAQQLALEGALIGAVAAVVGVGLGALAVQALAASQLDLGPRRTALVTDGGVLALAAVVAIAVATLASVGALAGLPRANPRAWLATRDGGAGGAAGSRVTRALIVAEVAIAILLTVVAGLAARSFLALRETELGYSAERVTAARITLPAARYRAAAAQAFFAGVQERVRALPQVSEVALVSHRPLSETGSATHIGAFGKPIDRKTAPVADIRVASAEYFETLRVPTLSGVPAPGRGASNVAISKLLADQLWPGQDPIGQRLVTGFDRTDSAAVATVVSVVGDVRLHGPRSKVRGALYLPLETRPVWELDLVVRAASPLERLVPMIRSAVWSLDSTIPVHQVATLSETIAAATARDRVTSWLLTGFSGVSLVLAAVGIAGVLLVELSRRRRELGVRLALGASPGQVRREVMVSGLRLVVPGLVLGIAAALVATPVMRAFLYGVDPGEGSSYLLGVAILLLMAALALVVPIRRATSVDPVEVLRGE